MPFGPYATFDECVEANQDKESPKAFCGWLKHRIEGSAPPVTALSYREKLSLAVLDLGGAGSGNFGHAGRPGEVGGSAPGSISDTPEVRRVPRPAANSSPESVQRHVDAVSERMGFDRSKVDVVDIEPRKFEVAGRQLSEGGHFDPATGRIEINVRTNAVDSPAIQGLVAHEVMHAQDDAVTTRANTQEHDEIRKLTAGGGPTDPHRARDIGNPAQLNEFDRLFRRNGFPRDEKIPEIEARWPASATLAKYHPNGDSYLGTWSQGANGKWAFDEQAYRTRADQMEKDDGFTAYSRLYWVQHQETEGAQKGWARQRAIQETLAEVAAYHDRAARGPWKEGVPAKSWQAYGAGVRAVYPKVKK